MSETSKIQALITSDMEFMTEHSKNYKKVLETHSRDEYFTLEIDPPDGSVHYIPHTWGIEIHDSNTSASWESILNSNLLPLNYLHSHDEMVSKIIVFNIIIDWWKQHTHIGKMGNYIDLDDGGVHYVKDCIGVEVSNGTTVVAVNSDVWAYGGETPEQASYVIAKNNSKVMANDNSVVRAYDGAKVFGYDNAQIILYGNAKAEVYQQASWGYAPNEDPRVDRHRTIRSPPNTKRTLSEKLTEATVKATPPPTNNTENKAKQNMR